MSNTINTTNNVMGVPVKGSEQTTEDRKEDGQVSFVLHDIEKLRESIKFINDMLNNACKKGFFELDEAFQSKIACENLSMSVSSLKDFQDFAAKLKEQNDAQMAQTK